MLAAAARLALSGSPAGGAPLIGRGPAQRLARQELARPIYRPSWPRRVIDAIGHWLHSLLTSGSGGAQHVSWWAVAGLAVLIAALIAGAVHWLGPARRSGRLRAAAVLGGAALGAAGHRRRAADLAGAGDYAAAIIERVRAIAADLEQRGVVAPRPGRTAAELAAEAAGALPAGTVPDGPARLDRAARLFADVRYGGRRATRAGYEQVRDLDTAIAAVQLAAITPAAITPAAITPGGGAAAAAASSGAAAGLAPGGEPGARR